MIMMVITFLSLFSTSIVFAAPISQPKTKATGESDMGVRSGVPVAYQLPTDGPLPRTYLVTLAIVDVKNPEWIISQFLRGEPRTVTAQNHGKFTDIWDGLDENVMPVPPGTYAVKGIYMPAKLWDVDHEYHAVIPQYAGGASSWLPNRQEVKLAEGFGGDPCGSPFGDLDVGPNGVAVFYWTYLENGINNPMLDLNKPAGRTQILRGFGSGGAGGGDSTCTDGVTVWSFSTDGGKKYVYRADGQPFGDGRGANRGSVYLPDGWVKGMACAIADKKTYVYVAQAGKIEDGKEPSSYIESDVTLIDKISVHEGDGGKVLKEVSIPRPVGIVARGGYLYALHGTKGQFAVSSMKLQDGIPTGEWQRLFAVPAAMTPYDIQVDSRGRIYLCAPQKNRVYQFDRTGKQLLTYGRLEEQKSGSYDPLTLMSPTKLAVWTDSQGKVRLLISEHSGPNRISEWSDDGKLIREFQNLQTKANDGYSIDPEHPTDVYIPGQDNWLTRFKVDYEKNIWTVDAVWPHVGDDPKSPGIDHPRFIRSHGQEYIACGRSRNIYRRNGDRWLLSSAIITERVQNQPRYYTWHDENGDGKVQEDEYRKSPLLMPGALFGYHGSQWNDDLAMISLDQAGPCAWRLAPSGFDSHNNPIFKSWQKLLTDPVFAARISGKADAVHGGNELDEKFSSDWAMVDGTASEGYVIAARGGHAFSANEGAQMKVSRYVPDGKGGYRLKWRTGRAMLGASASRGEIYGLMHINKPINGLVPVIDQSRCGVVLYNAEDGLYVDTLFTDSRRLSTSVAGLYALPGEFFAGATYTNKNNGRIFMALGKITPLLFEASGWSLKEYPVKKLTTVTPKVTIRAAQLSPPPEIALTLRGGAGKARLARFAPAIGGAVLDGSMVGWESCLPVEFQSDSEHTVEVRCLYDPEHLYLRWHARTAISVDPKPILSPQRIFSHDRLGDTLSFYVQGNPNVPAGGPVGGRPGDARFVFSLVKENGAVKPVVVGMYPHWSGSGTASPATYRTPVGAVNFAHVGIIKGVTANYMLDKDGKGFVIAACLPRTAIPGLPVPGSDLRTLVNFEATFSGHNKFWWSNADGSANRETYDEPSEARLYPGSWAPVQFQGLDKGVLVRNWQLIGPFGGPGAENFAYDLRGYLPGTNRDYKQAGREFCDAKTYPPDVGKVELNVAYKGDMIQGYWSNPGSIGWHVATVADLDTRVICGPSAQVWYGATWAYVPQDLAVTFTFQGHEQTFYRWFLNGQKVAEGENILPAKPLVLKKGWNQIMFRGYCIGYPPFRAGLVFNGPVESLWQLRLSHFPQKE